MEQGDNWPLWAVALQDSSLGLGIRHSTWLYPLGNVLHVLGVAVFVGSILALDLRFLGLARRHISLEGASKLLTPVAIAGILMLVPGGVIVFIADAGPLAANGILQLKLSLAVVGIANALLFRSRWTGRPADWDAGASGAGRAQVLASIAIWLAVPTLGRLIAYF